eukprot:14812355-Alexandrium_andersonii.AAC.2
MLAYLVCWWLLVFVIGVGDAFVAAGGPCLGLLLPGGCGGFLVEVAGKAHRTTRLSDSCLFATPLHGGQDRAPSVFSGRL